MKKAFPLFIFFCLFCAASAFPEEVEINSEIINVSPRHEFFIIRAGEDAGIEMGDGLIVHRGGKKIAEAYIIEVRENLSAAEIISIENGYEIERGDSTLTVKEIEIEGLQLEPEIEPQISNDAISIMVNTNVETVFAYTVQVLKEEGYSITSSNRAAGILLATKPIALSLMKELWADATAAIGHNLVASFDIKSEGYSSRLMVSGFKEHSRKARHIKRPVTKNSSYYNELLAIISKIKERAEY